MGESILKDKSFEFAKKIVRLSQFLMSEKKDFVLSKQILKSGTSIGAQIREAEFAQSKADFINKMSIALKESNETDYWLELLVRCGLIEENVFLSLKDDCRELLSMLVATVKTSKLRK